MVMICMTEKMNFRSNDWTNLENLNVTPYQRSKTVAEKLVWEFRNDNKPLFDICTVNPGMVVGPLLTKMACKATSSVQVKQFLTGAAPLLPRTRVPVVDIRDVSLSHIRALDMSRSVDGKRYILCEKVVWMIDLCQALKTEYSAKGFRPTTW